MKRVWLLWLIIPLFAFVSFAQEAAPKNPRTSPAASSTKHKKKLAPKTHTPEHYPAYLDRDSHGKVNVTPDYHIVVRGDSICFKAVANEDFKVSFESADDNPFDTSSADLAVPQGPPVCKAILPDARVGAHCYSVSGKGREGKADPAIIVTN